jgi:tetratricopeptide (TPR) repeat protein
MNRHQRRADARLRPTPSNSHAAELLQAGVSHHVAGRGTEAEACYRKVLAVFPEHADALHLLGVLAHQARQNDVAVALMCRALAQNPQNAMYLSNLGLALRDQGEFDEAIAAYCQAIRIKPDYAEAHCNLGAALRDQGKLAEAVAASRQAIVLKPDFAEAYNNLAAALTELGQLSEGRAALENAVRLAPRNVKFLRNLGEMVRFATGDPRLAALERLAEDSASLSIDERIELHFAVGKACQDVGRHGEAFRQWLDGNALKRRQISYDEAATLGRLDRVRSVFTPELIRSRQDAGQPSSVPVFIVGMPRSGTTLVEQILASHPQVVGGGELTLFENAAKAIRERLGGSASFPELASAMVDEDFLDLGTRYLAEFLRIAPSAARITDKGPGNFIFAGLIHLALPNAIIIHSIRDPVDTCVSCFSKLFSSGQKHTYDLAELGRYYSRYEALMAHWHRVLPPGRILDVRYEDVVADLEGQARHIVAHCGLDWDPRCLAFHQTERPVRTASATQVRQPIYNSAIGRWRVHEPVLGPLLAELGGAGRFDQGHAAPTGRFVA